MIAKRAATAATCGTKTPAAAAPSVETSRGQRRLSSVTAGRSSGSDICIRASASSRATGGEAALRRPTQAPNSPATSHHPTATSISVVSDSDEARATVRAASSVADAALSSTVVLRKSTNRTGRSDQQRAQQLAHAVGAVDHEVRLALELRRPLVGADADPDGGAEPSHLHELAEATEGVEVGDVIADVHARREVGVAEQADDPGALVDPHGRADLEHLAAPVRPVAGGLGALADGADRRLGRLLVGHAAPVQRRDRLLVLQPDAQAPELVVVGVGHEDPYPPRPGLQLAVELG